MIEDITLALESLVRETRHRAINTWAFLRLEPFDTSSEEGRAKERYRRVALTAVGSVIAKGIAVLTAMACVPLTLGYLGSERYGVWMTMSSVIAMLGFADLGMGNGLLNAIADANGKDDHAVAAKYVASAFFMLAAVAAILLALFTLTYSVVPWSRVFNITSKQADQEVGPAIAVFIVCFAANMPLGIAERVRMGYQEGFGNSLWGAGGNLLGLAGVLLAIRLNAGLPWLVLAMAGAPVFALFLNGLALFGFKRPWLRPHPRNVTATAAGLVLRTGLLFLALQIAITVGYQSDNIVLAQILGAEAVTQYVVPLKLFSLTPMVLSFVLTPLWPAYGEAIARGDVNWARRTLTRSIMMGLLVNVPAAGLLLVFGSEIIRLWVGSGVSPSFLLLLGLCLWTILNSFSGPLAMFLNGANVIRFQVVCALLMGTGNLVMSIVLVRQIGIPGVVFGTVAAQVLFILVPACLYLPRLLSSMGSFSEATTGKRTVA